MQLRILPGRVYSQQHPPPEHYQAMALAPALVALKPRLDVLLVASGGQAATHTALLMPLCPLPQSPQSQPIVQ